LNLKFSFYSVNLTRASYTSIILAMTRFRLLNFAFLLFFAGVMLGVQFHSHPGGQEQLAHCKSCQVAHATFASVNANILNIGEISIPYQVQQATPLSIIEGVHARLGRAPPIC